MPRRFPILQFPNALLMTALIAVVAGRFTTGTAHGFSSSVYYLALGAWAYGEATDGVNWFRRLLGIGFAVYLIVTLALALRS